MRFHMLIIMDNLGCHSDISRPYVTITEITPNTTAVFQPLDAGVIAALQRRSKFRLRQRVFQSLDKLMCSGDRPPRLPRRGGLGQGAHGHLQDTANVNSEEWRAVPRSRLANCCLAAELLPSEVAADVHRQVLGGVPGLDTELTDESAVVALMANASLAAEVTGVDPTGRTQAPRRWLVAESDVEAVDETVDVVLAG